ncbi:MAG TPA: hypothetical protein VED40_05325 [Azospirillaceae bacterium]|nr:hypothetical protein [Azospirillaceae bacterium]
MKTIRRTTELPYEGDVFIYGAGKGGEIIRDILAARPAVRVLGFIDTNKSGTLGSLPIHKFSEFAQQDRAYDLVLIASMYYADISRQLKAAGITRVMNAYTVCHDQIAARRQVLRAWIGAAFIAALAAALLA